MEPQENISGHMQLATLIMPITIVLLTVPVLTTPAAAYEWSLPVKIHSPLDILLLDVKAFVAATQKKHQENHIPTHSQSLWSQQHHLKLHYSSDISSC